jgi:hypothetical protein
MIELYGFRLIRTARPCFDKLSMRFDKLSMRFDKLSMRMVESLR